MTDDNAADAFGVAVDGKDQSMTPVADAESNSPIIEASECLRERTYVPTLTLQRGKVFATPSSLGERLRRGTSCYSEARPSLISEPSRLMVSLTSTLWMDGFLERYPSS